MARRAHHLRDPRAFPAYLRRTVVNLANSFFRRRRLERAYLERESRAPEAFHPEHDPGTRDALWRVLHALPPKQRAAVVLRFYEDLSEEETARLLGCPKGTVKSLVSRGLEALRRAL